MSAKLEKYLTGQRMNLDVESPDDNAYGRRFNPGFIPKIRISSA